MKWTFFFSWILAVNPLAAQPDHFLWYDKAWPDTIVPVKMETDTLDSLGIHHHKEKFSIGGFDLYRYREGLYLIKEQNGKFIRSKITATYHFNQGIFVDDCSTADINGDGKEELKITFRFDFLEVHYESGNSMTDGCSVYLDTNSLEIIFAIQHRFECAYEEVTYKDEEIAGRNALTEFIIVAREEGAMEIEYVLRNNGLVLEIVCNRLKKEGNWYQDIKIGNTGITKYQWENHRWIKLSR